MGVPDAHQLGEPIEEADVSGGQGTAGHQVVEDPTDVDHHLAGGLLLGPVAGQLGHQVVHHLGG